MDQQEITQARRVLAALTPGPYALSDETLHHLIGYNVEPLPQEGLYGLQRVEDASAILWLLQHAEALLALAERVAAVEPLLDAHKRQKLLTAVRVHNHLDMTSMTLEFANWILAAAA